MPMHNRSLQLAHMRRHPAGSSTVTAVNIFYNGQQLTGSALGGLLLRAGSTYTLVAKDQSGNTLSNAGTWSSSDATNAPINASTGLVSPSALAAATFTYTHTASGHTATANATVLPATTPISSESLTYANDAAFRANILSSVSSGTYVTPAPTGTTGSLYTDGTNEGLFTLDNTRPFMGNQTLLMTFPGGDASYGQLAAQFNGHTLRARVWLLVVKRYDPGFTTVGSGTGGAASYKDVGCFGWGNSPQGGDSRVAYSNTTGIYSSADLTLSGGIVGGFDETSVGTESTEWSSGKYLADIVLYEARSGTVMAQRVWRFYLGDHPLTTPLSGVNGGLLQAACNDGIAAGLASYGNPFGLNYNRTRNVGQVLYKSVAYFEYVDGTTNGDPYGLLQDATTPTLTGISGGSIAHGTTNNSIVLTGTNFTANCWPVFSNAKVYTKSITVNSTTQITVVVDVDATATTGAGTVLIHKGAALADTATQTVTVT